MMEKNENGYELIQLKRTKELPLRFYGRELACFEYAKKEKKRWDSYRLYETKDGKYVLYHEYMTYWDNERRYSEAWVALTLKDALLSAVYENKDGVKVVPEVIVDFAFENGIDISEHVD